MHLAPPASLLYPVLKTTPLRLVMVGGVRRGGEGLEGRGGWIRAGESRDGVRRERG